MRTSDQQKYVVWTKSAQGWKPTNYMSLEAATELGKMVDLIGLEFRITPRLTITEMDIVEG